MSFWLVLQLTTHYFPHIQILDPKYRLFVFQPIQACIHSSFTCVNKNTLNGIESRTCLPVYDDNYTFNLFHDKIKEKKTGATTSGSEARRGKNRKNSFIYPC